ncbi:alpha-N-acetylglucosaminidase [Streptomyces sparsogenes]|uniref:Alpha-N-acetylglucosaminidase n=1 Tax=Streptomyces sparsogenes DSM 40356 TaxID=1331668 RepID=A0A1R1SHS6_9ACTN|nr:alpha-N-acetylglucosaminidase [Streptomyces sparsogenes]OMI37823.1 alpha-N-acetylglucosaminidase [Streptomyces sparsogenes DSM 40356]
MSDLSRRTLIGTAGALGVGAAIGSQSPAAAEGVGGVEDAEGAEGATAAFDAAPARAALKRLLPEHAEQFRLVALEGEGGEERFEVSGKPGRIEVAGTSPAVLLTGVHWYLKYTCHALITWSGDQLDLPKRLPAPRGRVERSTALPHRFAFNDTHDGYTAPFAGWDHWEHLIDVAALHGCNELLVTAGQEAVYHRLLKDFGYSDEEARVWLPAPSHQPWWLLQNMSGYGGPVSPELLAKRTELGQKIAGRLRELGMRPVFPGYFGTVPDGFAERNPGARTVPQGTWNGLERPDWLDPRTESFRQVAAAFYRHQEELFGACKLFKMDLLHEGGAAGDVPVADAARAVETALRTARPGATWVILGWQANPRRELLDAVDRDRMLVVDGLSDLDSITDREKDWGSVPYAFGTIPNFGGRTTIGAKTHIWARRFTQWRDKPGSKLVGTAYMAEAVGRDPAAFELFSELAWRDEAVDREEWFRTYADVRLGGRDDRAREAYAALRDTAYQITSSDGRPHDSVFSARPDVTARSGTNYATRVPAFDLPDFDAAFAALLAVRPALRDSDAYRHDLTDLARQALADRSWTLIPHLHDAYARKDLATFRALARLWLKLMRLSDDMTGAHRGFLLGPWLEDAKRMASGEAEAAQLEHAARALITTWADRVTADEGKLANYANRDWNGLIGDFHLPQWQSYLDELEDALAEGREPRDFDWFAVEEPWTRERKSYPVRPTADAHRTARRVYEALAKAPYQGAATVSTTPPQVPPGGAADIAASLRNLNGLRATGRVDFDLTVTGLDPKPQGDTWLPSVAPAKSGEVHWRATAPGEPLKDPLKPLPYELAVEFGPRGEDRVRLDRTGTLWVAGPLDPGLRTVTNNGAVFGQLGERFAIDGAGRDLWKATAEFGSVYREGALAVSTAVTVKVDSQAATGAWARAGIIARDSLATAGSLGFVNLSVTPSSGVVLSYDTNGDGTLDAYKRVTGVKAPVLLRLTRVAAASYKGELSTDDGATWRAVGTVTAPGGAGSAQDVGIFMSAAHGGNVARGTVEFSGWRVG